MPHRFLSDSDRRVAIVGMTKNVGKTSALNALLDGLAAHGTVIGLLSVGVDGEAIDAIGGHAKPPVEVHPNMLVCTSDASLRQFDATHDVVATTRIRSALGEVLIAQVKRPGDVVLSGVRHRRDVRELTARLVELGASRVIIDGAFDRIAAASPEASDAVIAVTGMEIGATIAEVVERTSEWVRRLRTPVWTGDPPPPAFSAERGDGWVPVGGALVLGPIAGDPARTLYAPGLVSDASLTHARQSLRPGGTLICEDPTRILASRVPYERFLRDFRVYVRVPVQLRAVCANPTTVAGVRVESGALVRALASALDNVPVIDVLSGEEQLPC